MKITIISVVVALVIFIGGLIYKERKDIIEQAKKYLSERKMTPCFNRGFAFTVEHIGKREVYEALKKLKSFYQKIGNVDHEVAITGRFIRKIQWFFPERFFWRG